MKPQPIFQANARHAGCSFPGMAWTKLGEILVARYSVPADAVKESLRVQTQGSRLRLGELLVRMRALHDRDRIRALAYQLGIPIAVNISRHEVPSALLYTVPFVIAERHCLFPISLAHGEEARELVLAMADPTDLGVLMELERATGCRIFPAIAGAAELRRAIMVNYGQPDGPGKGTGVLLVDEIDYSGSTSGVIPLRPTAEATTEFG